MFKVVFYVFIIVATREQENFFIEIKMPVGTKAAFVDQYSYADQKHVVIAPSQKFRVIDYEKTDNYEKLIWEAIVSK